MTVSGYLRAVLVDGAQPFVYRPGVARLLGHVDNGLQLRFVAPVTSPSFPTLRLRIGRGQPPAVATYPDSGHVPSAAAFESAVFEGHIPVSDGAEDIDYPAPPTPRPAGRTEPPPRLTRVPNRTADPPIVASEMAPPPSANPEAIVVPPLPSPAMQSDIPSETTQPSSDTDPPVVAPAVAAATTVTLTGTSPSPRRPGPRLAPRPPEVSHSPIHEGVEWAPAAATPAQRPAAVPSVDVVVTPDVALPPLDIEPLPAAHDTPRPRLVVDVDDEHHANAAAPAPDPILFRLPDIAPRSVEVAQWRPEPDETADVKPEPAPGWAPTIPVDPIVIVDDVEPVSAPAFWARRHVGRLRLRLLR
jgi:hypothetical protein